MKMILGLLAVLVTGSSALAQSQPSDMPVREPSSRNRPTEAGAPPTDVLPAQRPNDPTAPGSMRPTEAGAPPTDVLPAQRPNDPAGDGTFRPTEAGAPPTDVLPARRPATDAIR